MITKELLKTYFNEYNERYFNNELKPPSILFKNNKDGVVGKFRYENDRGKRKNPKIYINKCIHWNDEDLIDVMIHEMIHYYVIFIMGYDGFFSHGFKFRKKRKEIRNKGQIVHIRYSHLKYNSEV